jgi:hypothetical protein
MKNKTNYAIILLTLFLVWTFFAGCDIGPSGKPTTDPTDPATPTGNGSILGRVVDESEEPIEGATVSLYFGKQLEGSDFTRSGGTLSDTDTTDEAGGYSFKNLATDYEYYLVIEAPGKKTLKISFNLSSNSVQYLQSLLPDGSGTIEAVLPVPITLAAPSRTGDNVTLTWSQSVNDNFQAYTVLRNESAEFDPDAAVIVDNVTTKATVTTTDTLPNPDTTYFYRVFEKVSAGGDVYIWVGSNVVNTAFTLENEWSQLGEVFITAPSQGFPRGAAITADENGVVYVAYIEIPETEPNCIIVENIAIWKYVNNSWVKVGTISHDQDIRDNSLRVAVGGGVPYIAFLDRNSKGVVYSYDLNANERDVYYGDRLTESEDDLSSIEIAADAGFLYVAFHVVQNCCTPVYRQLSSGVYVAKYDDSADEKWTLVGVEAAVGQMNYVGCLSLKIHNGTPYLAIGHGEGPYTESRNRAMDYPGRVFQFDSVGNSWIELGEGFSEYANKVELSFLGNIPYVSYVVEGEVNVKKYIVSTETWEKVPQGSSVADNADEGSPLSLVNFGNTLCLAYYKYILPPKELSYEHVNVFKFTGEEWELFSEGEFDDSQGLFVKMISTGNKLYVLYVSNINEPQASTRQLNGEYYELKVKQYGPVPKNNK